LKLCTNINKTKTANDFKTVNIRQVTEHFSYCSFGYRWPSKL